MTDTSDPLAPRSSRTTPEAISERSFSQVKRGYAESEVRAYLRMVSSDFAAAASRERDLTARLRELEERLRKPSLPPSDQDLITALGEETARVLGQARESALELRAKAEEHARRVVREAQETARELRTTTQQAVETKTREAEDAARARAKEIVGEARGLRERVLNDLNERRQELERQIADLRAGRGKLVETYELVERALTHAARVMAEEPSVAPEVPVADAPDRRRAGARCGARPRPRPLPLPPMSRRSRPRRRSRPTSRHPPSRHPSSTPSRPRRNRRRRPPTSARCSRSCAPSTSRSPGGPRRPRPSTPLRRWPMRLPVPNAALAEHGAELEPLTADDPATAIRDAALTETADDLVRRGKRALQDEQNDLLDGLRRQRGKIDTAKVLPPFEDQLARWAHVLQPAVDAAYSAGAGSVDGSTTTQAASRGLLTELAGSVVTPLRERLAASLDTIDARTPADAEIAIAQSLGARYREWRGEQLEGVLGDALAVAYSRGVFDAAPDGTRLRWVPAIVGKCPDCDDNALEPTVKGSDFPTGQPHPPAHPGCRCLLVVDAP